MKAILILILLVVQILGSSVLQCKECKDFFGVLVSYDLLTCSKLLGEESKHLEFLKLQMTAINSHFSLFVETEDDDCVRAFSQDTVSHPLLISNLNGSQILESCNFSIGSIRILNTWPPTRSFAHRKSEIYRLCIARLTSKAYIDLDTVLLSTSSHIFEKEFAVVEVSRNTGFSMQFSNAAFCLGKRTLDMMMDYQDTRIHAHDTYVTQERLVYNEEDLTATTVIDFNIVTNDHLIWKPTELGFDTFYIVLSRPHHGDIAYYRQPHPFIIRSTGAGLGHINGLSKFMERCLFYQYKLVHMPYSAVAFVASINSQESYTKTLWKFRQSYLDATVNRQTTADATMYVHSSKSQVLYSDIFNSASESNEYLSQSKVRANILMQMTTVVGNVATNDSSSENIQDNGSNSFVCTAIFTTLDELLAPEQRVQTIGGTVHHHRRLKAFIRNDHDMRTRKQDGSPGNSSVGHEGAVDSLSYNPHSCCTQLQQIRHGRLQEMMINMINQVSRLHGEATESDKRLIVFAERSSHCIGCFCDMLKSIEESANITADQAGVKSDRNKNGLSSSSSTVATNAATVAVESTEAKQGASVMGIMPVWAWISAWLQLGAAFFWQHMILSVKDSYAVISSTHELSDPKAHHRHHRQEHHLHRQCDVVRLPDAHDSTSANPLRSAPLNRHSVAGLQQTLAQQSLATAATITASNISYLNHFSKAHKLKRVEKVDTLGFSQISSGGRAREDEEDDDDNIDDQELQTDTDISYDALLQTVSQRVRIVEFDRDALLTSCVHAALAGKVITATADGILHKILYPTPEDPLTSSDGLASGPKKGHRAKKGTLKGAPNVQQQWMPEFAAAPQSSQKSIVVPAKRRDKQGGPAAGFTGSRMNEAKNTAKLPIKTSNRPGPLKGSPKGAGKGAPKGAPKGNGKGTKNAVPKSITLAQVNSKKPKRRSGNKNRRLTYAKTVNTSSQSQRDSLPDSLLDSQGKNKIGLASEDSLDDTLDNDSSNLEHIDNSDHMDWVGSTDAGSREGIVATTAFFGVADNLNASKRNFRHDSIANQAMAAAAHVQATAALQGPPGATKQTDNVSRPAKHAPSKRRRVSSITEPANGPPRDRFQGKRTTAKDREATAATADTSSSQELKDLVHACLAWRYGMTYVSPELLLLLKSSRVYHSPFISVAAKKQTQRPNSLAEGHAGVTASSYCLPPTLLLDVVSDFILRHSSWYNPSDKNVSPQHFHEDQYAAPLIVEAPVQQDGIPAKRVIRKAVSPTLRTGHDQKAFSPITAALQSLLLSGKPVRVLTQNNPRTVVIPNIIDEVKELGLSFISISSTIFLHAHKTHTSPPGEVDHVFEAKKKRAEDLANSPQQKNSPFYVVDTSSEYDVEGFDRVSATPPETSSTSATGLLSEGDTKLGPTWTGSGLKQNAARPISSMLTFRGVVKAIREGVRDPVPTMSPIMALFNLTEWEGLILP